MHTILFMRFKVAVCLFGFVLVCPSTRGTDYYVAQGGQTPGDYKSWGAAASNIADAVALAVGGDTVWVSNGIYTVGAEILVAKGLAVRSFNNGNLDRDGTIIRGNYPLSTNRVFRLTHAGALVEGFTITNGCVSADNGGGVSISSGTLRNCLVTGNVSTNNGTGGGGGVYLTGASSVVTNCDILANVTYGGSWDTGGGGVKIATGATIWNSNIRNNRSPIYWTSGGGIHTSGGNIFNCTIISNTALDGYTGGGVWVRASSTSTLRNCLIKGNDDGRQNGAAGICGNGKAIIENCTVVENFGRGIGMYSGSNLQICNTISFFNTWDAVYKANASDTLVVSNCCLTATNFVITAGSGNFIDTPAFQNRANGDFRLLPWSVGVDQGLTLPWMSTAEDLNGNARLGPNGLADVGAYETTAAAAPIYYVAQDGQTPSPTGDYTSWAAAASNLQDVVQSAPDGSTILVKTGVYTLSGGIDVQLRTIRSFNDGVIDPANTIIDGNAVDRCFSLPYRESTLDGLTITNGYRIGHGGGVYMVAGRLQNCIVTGNIATNGNGGGVYATGPDSLIADCEILGNLCSFEGGPWIGGGGVKLADQAVLRNSRIAFNDCSRYWSAGGGVHASGSALIANCQVVSNLLGNGYALGLVSTHGWGGGGVWVSYPSTPHGYGATLRNCLLQGNAPGTTDRGAGVGVDSLAIADVQNCTIVGNYGRALGADGSLKGTFRVLNTVAYGNTATTLFAGNGGTLVVSNSCVSATNYIVAGSGNFTNDPQFVNASVGNFRLRPASPCVDAGLNLPWMANATDLDGSMRVDHHGVVDMGCYETLLRGTVILVR